MAINRRLTVYENLKQSMNEDPANRRLVLGLGEVSLFFAGVFAANSDLGNYSVDARVAYSVTALALLGSAVTCIRSYIETRVTGAPETAQLQLETEAVQPVATDTEALNV